MAETPESNKEANRQLKPSKMPSPKRGAFPTPKAEIEKAKPYIPETGQEDDKSAMEPVSPEKIGASALSSILYMPQVLDELRIRPFTEWFKISSEKGRDGSVALPKHTQEENTE
jgi:hypothetical protein